MKNRKLIIISVCSLLLLAAITGFYISFDVSPQIAFARIFIDVGVIIALIALMMGLLKEQPIITGNITYSLKQLAQQKFQTRIKIDESDPLCEISQEINKLAHILEQEKTKQEQIRKNLREELLPQLKKKKETDELEHSFHPELGPVKSIPIPSSQKPDQELSTLKTSHEKIPTRPPVVGETELSNTLVISKPPEDKLQNQEIKETPEQDLGELYQAFIDAQKQHNISQVEYTEFLQTVEETKNNLLKTHKCSQIQFLVVNEKNQVALQPKILR